MTYFLVLEKASNLKASRRTRVFALDPKGYRIIIGNDYVQTAARIYLCSVASRHWRVIHSLITLFASLQSILNKHSITHGGGAVRYQSNHVKIINRGKTAAIDCKAFLVINTDSERVAWMLPTNKE